MNYEVPTKEMLAKVKEWRESMVEDHNNGFVGRSFLDNTVVARYLNGNANDIRVMMQWIETLTHKIEQLEKTSSKDTPTV